MTDTAVAVVPSDEERERDRSRKLAILKAVGLDRVPAEQRELTLAIARQYELDLMLKHLVMVDGRPYITRDGLLHVAHRSGQLDGIEVTDPEIVGDFWRASATVYRKDMSRGFRYTGRYPTKGGNQRFAPEMAVKVAEVMALRRAFDVSAPVIEERWDIEQQASPPPEPPLRETIAARKAALTEGPSAEPASSGSAGGVEPGWQATAPPPDLPAGASAASADPGIPMPAPDLPPEPALARCPGFDTTGLGACRKPAGHEGLHANGEGETWRDAPEGKRK